MDERLPGLVGEGSLPPSMLQKGFRGRATPPVPPPPLHLADGEQDLRDSGRAGSGPRRPRLGTNSLTPMTQATSFRSPSATSAKSPSARSARSVALESGLSEEDIREIMSLRDAQERKEAELVEHAERNRGGARRRTSVDNLKLSAAQRLMDSVISNWVFDSFIGACICLNAFTIGVESTYTVKDQAAPEWVQLVEYAFLAVYSMELAMRVYVHRLNAFTSWVKFDAFLVVCGALDVIVKLVVTESPEALANIMLVRMLRLARLARAARLLVQFKVLWLLVQGLMNSVMTILWTFVIIFVLIYIFAIIGLELFRADESAGEEYQEAAAKFNAGLGHSLLTLVQFLTLDSIGSIYVPICIAKPWLTFYFASFILVVSVALMNLVTALMVDSALSQSSQDKEAEKAWEVAKRKKALPKLKAMFMMLDEDGSGELELEELRNAPEELREQLMQISNGADPEELFHMLDIDGSGSIEVDEFCEGVLKVSQNDKPMELLRIMRQCGAIQESSRKAVQLLENVGHGSAAQCVQGDDGSGRSGPGSAADGKDKQSAEWRSDCSEQSTADGSVKADASALEALGTRVGDVEARISGVECQLSGIQLSLRRIADALEAGAPKPAGAEEPSPRPPSRPESDAGGRPPAGQWT